jgi:hypothetical protein
MASNGDKQGKPRKGLVAALRNAFAIESYDESSLAEEERAALDSLALSIHSRRMTAPAIMFIESHRHMNFLGSQLLVMAEPVADLASPVLNPILQRFGMYLPLKELPVLQAALEKRYSIEYLIQQLERYAAEEPAAQPEPTADPTQPPAGGDGPPPDGD